MGEGSVNIESFITWKWKSPGYHTLFTSSHVNALARMVLKNYSKKHRFICVTDDPIGIEPWIETIPLDSKWADIPNPSLSKGPSCYRRLAMFKEDAAKQFGSRFVSLDLDCIVTGNLEPLLDIDEEFAIWGDTSRRNKYNGSLILMTAGARPKVWREFDPVKSPQATKRAGMLGSDQAWIAYCLGPKEKVFNKEDGVYSFRNHIENKLKELPENARIVFFHGTRNPWDDDVKKEYGWVSKHWG